MRKIITFAALLVITMSAYAQTGMKANYQQALEFKEKFGRASNFSVYPHFINDTDVFWYDQETDEGPKYYIVDPAKKSKKLLFDTRDMAGQMSELTKSELKSMHNFRISDFEFDKKLETFTFEEDKHKFTYNRKTGVLTAKEYKAPEREWGPSAYKYSPDSLWIVYSDNHNLYIKGNEKKGTDTTEVQLTTDGNKYCSYAQYPESDGDGLSNPCGRWSKNGKRFIIEKEDLSKLKFMYVIDNTTDGFPELKPYKYAVPGDSTIKRYTLSYLDVDTKKITEINADKWRDQYVSMAYQTEDGEKLFFWRTKRTWDEKELCVYNFNTKEIKVLFNEVDKPYFDYVIAQSHFINDGKEIIHRSERNGFGHFYLYDGETGEMKRQLTEGNYVTGQVIEIDTLKRDVYFYAFGKEEGFDPYYYVTYKVNLDKGGVTLLTDVNANHKVSFPKSKKYLIDTYSTVEQPHKAVIRNSKGKEIMSLEELDITSLTDKGWVKPERFKVKSADGITDIYGVMWKPMDFDSTKTYPIISEVYPGPQFEYVPTSFRIEESYATQLAQLGFIVIQVGHRGGTPMRGKEYHRYGYGNMRDYPLADDKAAIEQLAQRYPFINIKKVGIFGHSGGGFMSTAALCKYSDFYTAAVSSAGNHDNNIYNTGWIEMNNGVTEVIKKEEKSEAKKEVKEGEWERVTPKTHADTVIGFKARRIQTNMELAKNYKGHLLLVHGLMDTNVNPAHSIRMADALIKAGKNFDMIFLPNSTHGFSGNEEDFFLGKMWRHFAKYLLDDASGDYQAEVNKYYEKTKTMEDQTIVR